MDLLLAPTFRNKGWFVNKKGFSDFTKIASTTQMHIMIPNQNDLQILISNLHLKWSGKREKMKILWEKSNASNFSEVNLFASSMGMNKRFLNGEIICAEF